ncbi:MAG: hypothetical protein BWY41_00025 [Candidatus Atribacteria bacterium ADurb.Bin276]|uniref:Uncharacterized protein n=1 Tax=Candidatus Atribacter allofermentans TaxID=1852833 RepID=A0A1V5T666_9BACT|nr:MAG: hypothetical protein BWY41_00025 [Candidatus Atribacteria bacterium ADurb.Bin276]
MAGAATIAFAETRTGNITGAGTATITRTVTVKVPSTITGGIVTETDTRTKTVTETGTVTEIGTVTGTFTETRTVREARTRVYLFHMATSSMLAFAFGVTSKISITSITSILSTDIGNLQFSGATVPSIAN